MTSIRRALLWPALFTLGLAGTGAGNAADRPLPGFNASYAAVALAL